VGPDGAGARLQARPFWQHALALVVLLAALVPLIGTDSAFVTDESFVVIQLDTIEDTGKWTLPHPVPEVDPGGAAFPLHGATRYEDGYTLYGKHPALIYLYLPVHRAFGLVGLVGLSLLGTWAAALVAARLAERIQAGSGVVALWLVGAGSPLFFDAYVIHAHTIAAALAALAVLLALRAMDEDRPWIGVGTVVASLGVALLRTEGVLFVGALGGAVGLFGLLRRRAWVMAGGAAVMAAGAAAVIIDRAWATAVGGSDPVALDTLRGAVTRTFVEARMRSFSYTWMAPGYRGGTVPEALTLAGAMLLVVGTVVVRRRPGDQGAAILAVAGAVALAVRSALEWGPVPGLLVAFCVGVVGLVLVGGGGVRSADTRFLFLVSGVFAVAVILTQYGYGGHTEWGGRYFALAVPLLGAVAAASLCQSFASWSPTTARTMWVSLVVATVALGVLAVSTVRAAHDRNRARSDGVLAAASELPVVGGQPPIVLTEDDQVPRLARGRYTEVRFLRVTPPEVGRYLERLADEGVEDVLLVSLDPAETAGNIPAAYEHVGAIVPHDLQYEPGGGLIRLHLVGS